MESNKRHREHREEASRKRRACAPNWIQKVHAPNPGSINAKVFPGWVDEHLDLSKFTYLEIESTNCEYWDLILKYGTEFCVCSFIPRVYKTQNEDGFEVKKSELILGHGLHEGSYKGRRLIIARFNIGEPVSSPCGPIVRELIVLFMEGYNQQAALREYLDELLERERMEPPRDKFQVYRWKVCRAYWYMESLQTARTIESVVLPSPLKKDILQDLEQFLHEDTRDWYNRHGIPYKRSYIFYGPPGTGKTSFIQALAGAYGRNVCFLQPNDPRFTDDTFKTCLQKAPENSIIVLEDIDALFNDRNSMNKSCPLTFTGLLNGLDGIGNALGQLFVLSTNHLERLDPALIRSGRVDRKFEFSYCTEEALQLMFKRFYPDTKVAGDFAAAVYAKTGRITAADLQQAFIANMHNTDVQMVEYMEGTWDPNGQKAEDEAFMELDRKLKKQRALLKAKRKRQQQAAKEALEKEVEAELNKEGDGSDTVDLLPVESGEESSYSSSS
jgi:chaperone BCS1